MAEEYAEQLCSLADELINGPMGLQAMKDRTVALWNGPKGLEAPFWILKCITNPDRKDLEFLLKIREERKQKGAEK